MPYVQRLIEEAHRRGIPIKITDTRRTFQQQRTLRHRFERGDPSILAAAKPGWSFHEYGLAIDVAVTSRRQLELLGPLGEAIGLRWGGRFGDPVHFDLGNRISIQQARREAGVA